MDTEQLLKESTQVAQEAAKSIGGTFERGRLENGKVVGGFSPVINSETLDVPSRSLEIPTVGQDTTTSSLSAVTNAAKESQKARTQLEKETAQAQEEAQVKASEQEARVRTLQERILGVPEEAERLRETAGIDTKTQRVTDFTNQLEALERAEVNELRALTDSGLTDVQRAARTREISRRFAFEKADVALLQSAANRDLLTAQSIIDSKIQAKLEPLKLQLDFESSFLERNFDLLDKSEQRAFQAKITAGERAFERQKSLEETERGLLMGAVSQNAPREVIVAIQNAETETEKIKAAGQYAGDILARKKALLEIQKIEGELSPSDKDAIFGDVSVSELPKLNQSERNDLISDWTMIRGIERMNDLIGEVGLAKLVTGQGSPEAREFGQLKENIIDILARERTGAVIGKDEAKSFKKILGVGLFQTLTAKDEAELNKIVSRTLPLFRASMDTINPSGEWESYLNAKYPSASKLEDPLGLGTSGTPSNDPLDLF